MCLFISCRNLLHNDNNWSCCWLRCRRATSSSLHRFYDHRSSNVSRKKFNFIFLFSVFISFASLFSRIFYYYLLFGEEVKTCLHLLFDKNKEKQSLCIRWNCLWKVFHWLHISPLLRFMETVLFLRFYSNGQKTTQAKTKSKLGKTSEWIFFSVFIYM